MAKEWGGQAELEKSLEEAAEKADIANMANSPKRYAKDRQLPEAAASNIRAVMALGSEAPLKPQYRKQQQEQQEQQNEDEKESA